MEIIIGAFITLLRYALLPLHIFLSFFNTSLREILLILIVVHGYHKYPEWRAKKKAEKESKEDETEDKAEDEARQ